MRIALMAFVVVLAVPGALASHDLWPYPSTPPVVVEGDDDAYATYVAASVRGDAGACENSWGSNHVLVCLAASGTGNATCLPGKFPCIAASAAGDASCQGDDQFACVAVSALGDAYCAPEHQDCIAVDRDSLAQAP